MNQKKKNSLYTLITYQNALTFGRRGHQPCFAKAPNFKKFFKVSGQLADLNESKEYSHLLAIIRRWKSGQSLNSIATWLNEKRVPSPMGKSWSWNSISNIIQRIKIGHLIEKGDHYELR